MTKRADVRIFILKIIFCSLMAVIVVRQFHLQILQEESYSTNTDKKTVKVVIKNAARGNIYDCNGKILATNRIAYNITMTDNSIDSYKTNRERQLVLNSVIYKLLQEGTKYGIKFGSEIKIEIDKDGKYNFTTDKTALLRFKADIFGQADIDNMTKEQRESSAEECIEYLSGNTRYRLYGCGKENYTKEELDTYGLPEKFTEKQILNIVGIRYMLSLNRYQSYIPVTVAKDIPYKMMVYIKENSGILQGVDIEEELIRVYKGGEAFAHILGYTKKVSVEELEESKKDNIYYTQEKEIGTTGIEYYMEDTLCGQDGKREVTLNDASEVKKDKVIKEAKAGGDVYLSIDMDLQNKVYSILEQKLADILLENIVNLKKFDKTKVNDASDIRIPIYDVYYALVNNNIINLDSFKSKSASNLERSILEKIKYKKKHIIKKLKKIFINGNTLYKNLSEETQEYINYIIDETGFYNKDKVDTEDTIYSAWTDGKICTKDFILQGLRKGWFDTSKIHTKKKYLTGAEMAEVLYNAMTAKLADNAGFEKKLFYYLLLDDKITGKDICMLLYKQKVISIKKKDSDYKGLTDGNLSPYEFMRKKIAKLEITPAQLALDPCSASAAIVNSNTGKLIACVTYPGYDNNQLANKMDSDYYFKLYYDLSLPFYNRASQQLTAPGSAFKPVTIAAGLNEGVIQTGTSIFCDGVFDRVTPVLRCWNHAGHGAIPDAAGGLAASCNDYLCEISYRLGMTKNNVFVDKNALNCIQKYAEIFGLNKKSGIEIAESEPHVTDQYAIPSAIGQGTHNYTTVQLARYANTLATCGKVFSLSLIQKTTDKNGKRKVNKPVIQSKAELDSYIWNTIKNGMKQFVKQNTYLKDMKISIAGKTGTAQEDRTRPEHSLFIGYAPVQQPEISIAVRIANGYGSSNAVMASKNILEYYFGSKAAG